MTMDFPKMWTTFALIGVFVFAFLGFIIQFENDNSVTDSILGNQIINNTYSGLSNNLSSFDSRSQSQRSTFEQENPTDSFGELVIFAIVGAGKTFGGMIVGIFNILIVLPATILGVDPVIIGVLGSMVIVGIIFALWRVYKAG